MNRIEAIALPESLAPGVQLDVYRLLVHTGTNGMVVGEVANARKVAAADRSFHLKALAHALVTVEQQGRFQRYRADLMPMRELISYLTQECCSGQPEQCLGLRELSQRSNAVPSASWPLARNPD
jgi:arsenate reductase